MFLCCRNLFVKKNNKQAQNCLDNLKCNTTGILSYINFASVFQNYVKYVWHFWMLHKEITFSCLLFFQQYSPNAITQIQTNLFPSINTDLLRTIHKTYRPENITVEFARKRFPVIHRFFIRNMVIRKLSLNSRYFLLLICKLMH